MNKISFSLDGDILKKGKPTLRVLGKTMDHLQSMIDRAWLDSKHGSVTKHAKLTVEDYPETEFFFNRTRKGSFIVDFSSDNENITPAIDQITDSISVAYSESKNIDLGKVSEKMNFQVTKRLGQLRAKTLAAVDYKSIIEQPDEKIVRRYTDRSIVKELDQMLSLIRVASAGASKFDLEITGKRTENYLFDRLLAEKFHKNVSHRQLGKPVTYKGILRQLDRGTQINNKKMAKFINDYNGKSFILHIASQHDFDLLHPFLVSGNFSFIGCPVLEYSTFDPIAGDVYFIDLA